jgi:molybdate/tungstate transport system substrate-binding protein
MMKTGAIFAAVMALWITARPACAGSVPLRVAYAGSMGAVMDRQIGPAFTAKEGAEFQGIGQGSYGLAHLLESGEMRADVFVSVTPGPMQILIKKGIVKEAVPIASTQMVIAYSPKSRLADRLKAAADGKEPWYAVLESPGVRFGRTDPATDPQGRNIVLTFMLAEKYYSQPGLADKILGPPVNPQQIFSEASLLARLDSGQIDASSGYLSAVESQHLPYIKLPPQINLADPAYNDSWYSKAGFTIAGPKGKPVIAKPEPLVFYAAALGNSAHSDLAAKFVKFIAGPDGQKFLREGGYDGPLGGELR